MTLLQQRSSSKTSLKVSMVSLQNSQKQTHESKWLLSLLQTKITSLTLQSSLIMCRLLRTLLLNKTTERSGVKQEISLYKKDNFLLLRNALKKATILIVFCSSTLPMVINKDCKRWHKLHLKKANSIQLLRPISCQPSQTIVQRSLRRPKESQRQRYSQKHMHQAVCLSSLNVGRTISEIRVFSMLQNNKHKTQRQSKKKQP